MEKTEGQRAFRARILIVAIALVAVCVALGISLWANGERVASQNGAYLESATNQTAQQVNVAFEDSLRDVQTAAAVFEESLDGSDIDPAEAAAVLDLPQFDHTFFITLRGVAYKPDGSTGVATEKPYYAQGVQGKSGVCYIADALFDGESVVAFYTPVKHEGLVMGVAVCAYRESTVAGFMTSEIAGQLMPTYLCQADGRVIASAGAEGGSGGKYINDVFAGGNLQGVSLEQLEAGIEGGSSVSFAYGTAAGTSSGYVTGLASFDWVIVRLFPASVTSEMVANANGASVLLVACLVAIAAVAVALLLAQGRQGRKPTENEERGMQDADSASGPCAKGSDPLAHGPSSKVESVFASSLTKDIQSASELVARQPEEADAAEAAREQAARMVQAQERLKGLGYQGKRILLVEDNAMATSIAQELLELTGAEVEHAENGKAAVEMLLESDPGRYDIVLMDIQMPVMNGYDAARAIRATAEERPDLGELPIIALSADMFADDIKSSQDAGMNDHIAKPLEVETLGDMLQKWLG